MSRYEDFHVGKLRVGQDARVITDEPFDASFTIGAEAADAITINIQLKNADGKDLDHACGVFAFLSSDSAGQAPEAASATLSAAAGTDGAVYELSTDNFWFLRSESDGDIDVVITETVGANTFYLHLQMPNGRIVSSGAITFAA